MASLGEIERHLEAGEWVAAVHDCGCLLETLLHEIYRRTEPNLSTDDRAKIRKLEGKKHRTILKFTLGDLTFALKTGRVFAQTERDFGRPLPWLRFADWKTLVELRNDANHANPIATPAGARFFAANLSALLEDLGWQTFGHVTAATHPFKLFKEFDRLELAVKPSRFGRSEPQDDVAHVLLHSIQPAYYLDKLELLQEYSRRAGKNPDFEPMDNALLDARTIVDGACALYGGLKRHEGREYFEEVRIKLDVSLTAEVDQQNGSWPEAIRLDFLGLCCYHLHLDARKDGRFAAADAFLQRAREAYESALNHFGRLAVPPLVDVTTLWKGYVFRNLGSVLADCGDRQLAGDFYRRALQERERVYQRLGKDCDKLVASQLLVEVELVRIDLAELDRKSDTLAESVARLLPMRQDLPSIWPHVEERLYECSIALNAPDVAEGVILAALEDRLSRLTGKRWAVWIRDEVRSRKVAHEAAASRCRERQTGHSAAVRPRVEAQ
jgi:hypothetical protein